MPAVVALPGMPPRGVRDVRVDAAFLAGDEFDRARRRPRLGSGARLGAVVDARLPALAARQPRRRPTCCTSGPTRSRSARRDHGPLGVPAAVLVQGVPAAGRDAARARPAVRDGRVPARTVRRCASTAGWNAHVTVRGVPIPMRFRPSPLVVVFKSFDEERAPSGQFRLDTYEFLDVDVY